MYWRYRVSIIAITKGVSEVKYVTGNVTVGIVDKIRVEGVHVLLGNDTAGGQMSCAV